MGAWEVLGIERTRETRDIRRAYARRLKDTHPEDDPAGFKALREAYEHALSYAERGFEFADGVFFSDGSSDEDKDEDSVPARPPPASVSAPNTPPPPAPSDPAAEAVLRETAEVEAAFGRLEALVDAFPPASDAALSLAMEGLVGSPGLQNLDLRGRIEQRLADLILERAPRADALIPGAIKAMGWRPDGRGALADAMDAVFQRQAALGYLREIKLKRHPHHDGYRALSRPPPHSSLSYVLAPSPLGGLKRIIARIDEEYPALEVDFPHLDAWRAWLEIPRLTPAALWTAILAAPILGLLSLLPAQSPSLGGFLVGAGVGGIGVLALAFIHLYAVLWPRREWRRRWAWRTPDALALAWVPATGALLLAAALYPAGPVTFWIQVVFGLLLILATAVLGDVDQRQAGQVWWVRLAMLNAYYWVWLAALALEAPESLAQMAPALIAAGVVAVAGSGSLAELWDTRLGPGGRMAGAGLLLANAALALLLTPGSVEAPERMPIIIALSAMAVIAARPMADRLGEGATRVRHWVGWAGFIGVANIVARGAPFGLQALCVWILAGPVVVAVGAIIEANEERRGY